MALLLLISAILCGFYVAYFLRLTLQSSLLNEYPKTKNEIEFAFISIVVAARNEEANIQKLLERFKKLDYPTNCFEIILVDDYSTDKTLEKAKSFPLENLICLSKSDFSSAKPYKKGALELAIHQSKGSIIACTDSDCEVPVSWLNLLNICFVNQKTVCVSGPVLLTGNDSLFEKFQVLEFAGLNYIGAVNLANNNPQTSNGANFAFLKAAFVQVGGYDKIDQVASGDDELLMQKFSQTFPAQIHFLNNPAAIVTTQVQFTFNEFLNQRIRWASKSNVYSNKSTPLTMFMIASNMFMMLGWIILTICRYTNAWIIFLGFIAIMMLAEMPFMLKACRFYGIQLKPLPYFAGKIIQFIYIPWVAIRAVLRPKYLWKNRKLK